MFVGHFGVALGAKKLAPSVSLGTLFMAALLADLLWLPLVLGGAEAFQIRIDATQVMPIEFLRYPYSHSLVATAFAAIVFCAARAVIGRTDGVALLTLASLVLSHWLLDAAVHAPDLPLSPADGSNVGLGLWNSIPGTIALEGLLLAGGLALYLATTRALNRQGALGPWGLVAVLVLAYGLIMFGPPPQTHALVHVAALSLWLTVAAGYWIDFNRGPARRDARQLPELRGATTRAHVRRKRGTAPHGARSRY